MRPSFRLLVVPGVIVDRWSRAWSQRMPAVALDVVPVEAADAAARLTTEADAGLVRLPVDRTTFQAIPLYTETTVVVVPRDHLIAAADEVTLADLADDALVTPADDVLGWDVPGRAGAPPERPATTAAAVELVADGGGVLVVPMSLARLYHRRDLTYRPVTDAPTSTVGLAWATDRYDDRVEAMIGVVRGRTANSTRGSATPARRDPAPRRGRRR